MRRERRRYVADLLRPPRYEVIPLDGIEERVVAHVPPETSITVTASPSKGLDRTIEVAERLAIRGYEVVPHVSARLVRSRAELRGVLARLEQVGIREALIIAGDVGEPVGPFEGALDLLRTMEEVGHHLTAVGITGYPESHPIIPDEETIAVMHAKAPYATHIVSQMCFDAGTIIDWVRDVRARGIGLPLHIGIAGVASRAKLLRISSRIGLGESARFLSKHGSMVRMALPGYAPDRLLQGLAPALVDPALGIERLHIYTFNDVASTEEWRQRYLAETGVGAETTRHRGAFSPEQEVTGP
jgi:methylenetetrahydrofolate reductase (NADPH)